MSNNHNTGEKVQQINTNRQIIQTSWPGSCFGCSQDNPYGLQLRYLPTEDGCLTRSQVPDRYCGFDSIVHGGIISTLLDETAVWTLAVQLGQLGFTVEFTIRYHKPVPTNTELLVKGTLVRYDARTAHVQSTVYSVEGLSLAEAESTWRLTTPARLSQIMGVPESDIKQFLTTLQVEVKHMGLNVS